MPGAFKRPADSGTVMAVPAKQLRQDIAIPGVRRTSSMLAPIMLLQGHDGEIFTAQFAPDGTCVASAGFDMKIFLWNVYGECENFSVLKGHAGAIMQVQFSADGEKLYSASTDKMVRVWDLGTGACLRKLRGHAGFVNSVCPTRRGPEILCSASDDGTVKMWDTRKKDAVLTLQNTYQVTATAFNPSADQIVSGGIDNQIKVWDVRKEQMVYEMRGHTDTVTSLTLSPDGNHMLSNSMDCTARIWDVRPFAPEVRCVKVFHGHQHNFEKNLLRCCWSPDGLRISAGSADRYVYVWDVSSRKIAYKLPGHQGSVNETHFHPVESILLSAGSDKKLYLGEIDY